MKASKMFSRRGKTISARHAFKGCRAALLVVLIGVSWGIAIGQAQQPDTDVPGAQVLTRGPVHEAFAGMVTFNPVPGIMVTKTPPDVIEEVPPEERPEGDNVTWIPGYWAWDDERSDFLWVSGTWRALPPGRQWMAGYWGKTAQGYQWTSGYWADATAREATYLPLPPATVEVGPNIAAPSLDYGWSPGCWIWYQGRYAWRPGYWALGRADWDWMPAHYVWTPRGYIFVGGFWDYPVERRGLLFAPVYFEAGVYARRGYFYSPTIVIDLGVFSDHLFLRPSYQHYYFGDYYAASYVQGGFYASFSFQSSRSGYDPIYSHQRWEHRQDRDWAPRVEASYQYRRDNETARPPRTWAAQRAINPATAESKQNRVLVATPMDQLVKRKDSPVRFQPVAKVERQQLAQRSQEVQKSRDQRQTLEAKAVDTTARKSGGVLEPAKVQLPRSPIVAKPANQMGRNQAPPKAQQAPKPDLKVQPKSEPTGRPPSVDRSNLQPEPRKPEPVKKSTPVRYEAQPAEKNTVAAPAPLQIQKPAAATQKSAAPAAMNSKAQSETRKSVPAAAESKPAAKSAVKPEGNQPSAIKEPTGQKANKQPVKQEKSAQSSDKQAQRVSAQPARERPAAGERGATQLLKKDTKKKG